MRRLQRPVPFVLNVSSFLSQLFLTFHSYGQYILYPWGYTDRGVPPNHRALHELAQEMNRNMQADYTIGSAAKVLYPAAG